MNIIIPEFKILKMTYYLLGKAIFKTCIKQKIPHTFFNDFCNSRNCSEAFRLRYSDNLKVEKIAERLSYDVRSVYKQIDSDMSTFGRWLAQDCSEAEAFEKIRCRIETAIFSEYNKREIAETDSKSWSQLRSDFLRALT